MTEAPEPHDKRFGATCSSGANLFPWTQVCSTASYYKMPAWNQGANYKMKVGTAEPLACHYPTFSITLHSWLMSLLLLLREIHSLVRALGWVPLAPKPWLLLLPVHESFSGYFLGSVALQRTWSNVAEMHKTHPHTGFCLSSVPCCDLPLAPVQMSQHEWELSSSDFSPTEARRFRHLWREDSWNVSNLFFFFFFFQMQNIYLNLGKHPSLWLFVWRNLEAFLRLDCLLSSVTICAVT